MIYLYIDTSSEYLYSALSKDNEIISFRKSKLEHDLSAYALDEISAMTYYITGEILSVDGAARS